MCVWTLPVAFLAFGTLTHSGRESGVSGADSLWRHFIAPNCIDKESCRDFLIFTIPAARSVAYSVAAWLASHCLSFSGKSKVLET